MTETIGFIGVGTIAAATVRGLRAAWPALRIHLSPRSEATSREFTERDPAIHREISNQAVVDASGIVVLSMLPTQLDEVVRGLSFRSDQIVVSCVAGAWLADLGAMVAPARACRLIPLPMIARREGPIVLSPALPEIHRLFAPLGHVVIPRDEDDLATYAAGGAVMSTFFALQDAITGWFTGRGADAATATTYVRSLFGALGETGLRSDTANGAAAHHLIRQHETPGGLNERVRRTLEAQEWFAAPGQAFDKIAALRRTDLREADAS